MSAAITAFILSLPVVSWISDWIESKAVCIDGAVLHPEFRVAQWGRTDRGDFDRRGNRIRMWFFVVKLFSYRWDVTDYGHGRWCWHQAHCYKEQGKPWRLFWVADK